jgi:hypothetical protein
MAEPAVKNGKTRAQLDAQLRRIYGAVDDANSAALDRAAATDRQIPWEDIRRNQRRLFRATTAYGNMTRDNRLIANFTNYRPADDMFTSNAEIEQINRHFGLERRTVESLMALRNNVVDYFDNNYRQTDERWDRMPWMQSITAVIDEYIRRKGGRL